MNWARRPRADRATPRAGTFHGTGEIMRNLLALIGALVVGFGGLGWYLGWYKVHVAKAPDGNVRIEADVDTKKVGSDTGDAAKKVGALIGDAVEKGAQDAKAAQ